MFRSTMNRILMALAVLASPAALQAQVPWFEVSSRWNYQSPHQAPNLLADINPTGAATPLHIGPESASDPLVGCVRSAARTVHADRGRAFSSGYIENDSPGGCFHCGGCFGGASMAHTAFSRALLRVDGPPGTVNVRFRVVLNSGASEIVSGVGGLIVNGVPVVARTFDTTPPGTSPFAGVYESAWVQLATNTNVAVTLYAYVYPGPYYQTTAQGWTEARVPLSDFVEFQSGSSAGYTVNVPDWNVVDNHWNGPSESAFVMLQPQSQSSCIGADLDLSVGAVGAGLTYQWRRNGVALVDGVAPSGAVISGALSNMLSVDGLGASDAGAYDCVVSGTYGTDTSAPANVTVGALATYGTAKVNSLGCTPTIGWSGCPSATSNAPFLVTASNVLNQRQGLMFYGYAPTAVPYSGGFRLVAAPIKRSPVMNSAGNPASVNDCSGNYAYDMNARIQLGTDPNLVVGASVCCQYWTRDPADSFGVGLTDALSFVIGD